MIEILQHIVGLCSDTHNHLDLIDLNRIPIIDIIKFIRYGWFK